MLDKEEKEIVSEKETVEEVIPESYDVNEEAVEIKSKAKKYGHLGYDEYVKRGGKPENYKDEEEFVKFGESYSSIKPVLDSMKQQLEKRDKALEAMLAYQERTKEREYQRAKDELKAKQIEAKNAGDIDAVEKLAKYESSLENEEQIRTIQTIEAHRQQALSNFISRNSYWYNDSYPDLKQRASIIDQEERDHNPHLTHDQLARIIEYRMKDEYPDIVGTSKKPRPVLSSNRSSINKSSMEDNEDAPDKVYKKLNSEHRAIYEETRRIMKKSGIDYTMPEFIKRLKADGEL